MNPMIRPRGATVKQARVVSVDPVKGVAHCLDTEGQIVEASLAIRRTGITPQLDQVWLIDRELTSWSLRALVDPSPLGVWADLALLQGWTYSDNGVDAPPSVRVTVEGWLEVSGVLTGGTVPGTAGTLLTIATVPAGLPAIWKANMIVASQIDTSAGLGHVRVSLSPDGTIAIAVTKVPYAPAWIDLAGLRARLR